MAKARKHVSLWPVGSDVVDGGKDCLIRFCPGYRSEDDSIPPALAYGVKECNEYGLPVNDRILTAQDIGEIVLKKLYEEI